MSPQGWLRLCVESFVLQGEVITGSSPHGTCKRTKQVWLGQCSSQLLAPLGPFRCRGSAQSAFFIGLRRGLRCPVPRQNMEKAGVNPQYLI